MIIRDVVFVYHLQEAQLLDWHSRIHHHEGRLYEIHYFLSGNGFFRNGPKTSPIQTGQLFLTGPDMVHGIQPGTPEDPLTYYALLFELEEGDLPVGLLADRGVLDRFPLALGRGQRLRFEELKNRYNSPNPWLRLASSHTLLAFLFDLLGRIADHGSQGFQGHDSQSSVYVEQAMDIFQKQVFGKVSLVDLAGRLRISPEYLIKLFRRHIGITPMRYFQNLKLEASVSLLLNTQLSVKEIGWKLGFSSQYHFSRNFKDFSGLCPSEYRSNYFTTNPTHYQTRIIAGPAS